MGMDSPFGPRDKWEVLRPGASRRRIAQTLTAAYGDGLLSEDTFARRIDQLFSASLIEPFRLISDLKIRGVEDRRTPQPAATIRAAMGMLTRHREPDPLLLALDWSGGQTELLIGRHLVCDVVLSNLSVSRRHARLAFRDGKWVLQDLQSTNGTMVNGERVGRCELRPGDRVVLGDQHLKVD